MDFGDAHAGAVGVLVGGGEPGPVYFDVGSGSDVPSTTHWSGYDGRYRRPPAEALRAVCACGWRGAAEYPLDRATVGDRPLYEADVDLTGPLADWTAHLSVVREAAVPLPEPLTALLVEMAERLNVTAADAPPAALRAADVLEWMAARDDLRQGPGHAPDRAGQVTPRACHDIGPVGVRVRRSAARSAGWVSDDAQRGAVAGRALHPAGYAAAVGDALVHGP
ncbi:hypothetical protein [Streptomyces virginiae]|uniref:hypothetical protein n=1 Tax=Streptomyces virginiae TaxID=1961 RepID=UPI0036F18438